MARGGGTSTCSASMDASSPRPRSLVVAAALIVSSLAMASGSTSADASTYVVTTVADPVTSSGRADASPGDGVCNVFADFSGNGSGAATPATCTLRAAMEEANRHGGHDRIEFSIPGDGLHRIAPIVALPTMTDPDGVTIDGYTQPGSRVNTADHGSNAVLRIELRGAGPGAFDGLYFNQSSDNVVRGLALFDFKRTIRFWGARAQRNEVLGNFIGTDATGTYGQTKWEVNSTGVQLEMGASHNRIGRPGNQHRNVISGNGDRGVGMFEDGTDFNIVQNNVIGLRPDGSARLSNWTHGVDLNWDASDNLIGGSGPGEGNVISGNHKSGVEISHNRTPAGVERNRVVGNLIGTDLTASSSPTSFRNDEFGVYLEGQPVCPSAGCPLDIARNEVVGNVIVGGPATVIAAKGAHHNVIADNLIGVLPNGQVVAGSARWGVLLSGRANDNVVRGNTIRGVGSGVQVVPFVLYGQCDGGACGIEDAMVTGGNTISRNSISGIAPGLGIDLWPTGSVTIAPDPIVQGGVRTPSIVSAVGGLVTVATCPGCVVEVFRAASNPPSLHGQGVEFVGAAAAGTAGTAVVGTSLPLGAELTATATAPDGSTSEFSARATMDAEPAQPPSPSPSLPSSPGAAPVPPASPGPGGLALARRCSIGQC